MARSCNPFPGRPRTGWRSQGAEHVAKSAGRANNKASAKIIRIATHLDGETQFATRHMRLDDIVYMNQDGQNAHDRRRRETRRLSYRSDRCRAPVDRIEDCQAFMKARCGANAMPAHEHSSRLAHSRPRSERSAERR